jgi:hypothetical protein
MKRRVVARRSRDSTRHVRALPPAGPRVLLPRAAADRHRDTRRDPAAPARARHADRHRAHGEPVPAQGGAVQRRALGRRAARPRSRRPRATTDPALPRPRGARHPPRAAARPGDPGRRRRHLVAGPDRRARQPGAPGAAALRIRHPRAVALPDPPRAARRVRLDDRGPHARPRRPRGRSGAVSQPARSTIRHGRRPARVPGERAAAQGSPHPPSANAAPAGTRRDRRPLRRPGLRRRRGQRLAILRGGRW